MRPAPPPVPWKRSPIRNELRALYAEVDALLLGWECVCSRGGPDDARCCHFAVTGREPYPTAVELEEARHAAASLGALARRGGDRRKLRMAPREPSRGRGECPLLSDAGRCRIYASRPFGCRTFFCHEAEGPEGPGTKAPRDAILAIGRRIADLSARFDPRDPHPRPLVRALEDRSRRPQP